MRFRLPALIVIAVLTASVVACQATAPKKDRPDIPDGPPPPDMTQPAEAAKMTTITGTAIYLEKIGLPDGCTLRVQLVNTRLADTSAAVVADESFPVTHGSPIPFSLKLDPTKLDERMSYSISASVRGPNGGPIFVTDTSVPVDMKSGAPIEFRMKMVRR